MFVGKPWPLALLMRSVAVLGVCAVMARRACRLPRWIIPPGPLRSVDRHWTDRMLRDFAASFAARLPVDQPCRFVPPDEPEPRVDVAPPHRLEPDEIRRFHEDGFLPPFDAFDPAEVVAIRSTLHGLRATPSVLYGFVTDRDRHFDCQALRRLMTSPAILERLAQLLGPDLVCWRSQIFCKAPRSGPIHWHQASTYMMEDNFLRPVLVPPDRNRLFQLTIWIPFTRVDSENGCLRFLPGSHRRIHTIRLGGRAGFYRASYDFECDIDPDRVVDLEMAPGQALIFSERTVHGSGPNRTDEPRLAFNYRVVPPEVRIHPEGRRYHRAVHMGERYDLARWSAILLRGEDRYGHGRVVRWQDLGDEGQSPLPHG